MKPIPLILTGFLMLLVASSTSASRTVKSTGPSHSTHKSQSTYSITTTMRILSPVRISDMNDGYQEAALLRKDGDLRTIRIRYYPLESRAIGENRNWHAEDSKMWKYLQSRPAANWDSKMRQDLIAELKQDGIDPGRLSDKALVEQVSKWLIKRCRHTDKFTSWFVYFPNGRPAVYPPLRAAFDAKKPSPEWTDQRMFGEEVLGKEMFYNKIHGDCTSTALLMATVLRALGIPTRIIVCIPAADPNDEEQRNLLFSNVHHDITRSVIEQGLEPQYGSFCNHLFNEVYIDHRWVRLNYTALGQRIVDKAYLGLMTHIYTCLDLSDVPLAQTWGVRFAHKAYLSPSLSSINPYMLLSVKDRFGKYGNIQNPPAPALAELRTVTVERLYRPDAPELEGLGISSDPAEFYAYTSEWIVDQDWHQLRLFQNRASNAFVLRSEGHPDLSAQVVCNITGDTANDKEHGGRFHGFGLRLLDPEKVAPGAQYKLVPINKSGDYQWRVADTATITVRRASSP